MVLGDIHICDSQPQLGHRQYNLDMMGCKPLGSTARVWAALTEKKLVRQWVTTLNSK